MRSKRITFISLTCIALGVGACDPFVMAQLVGSAMTTSYETLDDATAALEGVRSRAADGDTEAMNELAEFYKYGWAVRLTGKNQPTYNLYSAGWKNQLVRKDAVQSYKWYTFAHLCGDGDAVYARERVARDMTPMELAEAEKLVQGSMPADC